jgi:hypothetical protein
MNHTIKYLKDNLENNYVGISINPELVSPFLNDMQDLIGENFLEYVENQKKVELGGYHITIISSFEYKTLLSEYGIDKFINKLDHILKVQIDDLKLLGLGKAEKSGNVSYFVVCKSDLLDEIRRIFNLPEKDFHITLGFKHKNVEGVRKNELIKKTEPFLKKLKNNYFKEGETFEFIKGVKNFDLDFFKLIEPIKINDTTATFRCGDLDYITISLIDNQFLITSKWQSAEKLPILSDVLIQKKFRNL